MTKAFIVLVGGGHCAGKMTVCKDLETQLRKLEKGNQFSIQHINMKDYLMGEVNGEDTKEQRILKQKKIAVPGRYDFDKIQSDLLQAKKENARPLVILVRGLYALYNKGLRDLSVMKIFVDSDADTRLSRWILRDDMNEGFNLSGLLDNYVKYCKPEMNEFIFPTKEYADVILPHGSEPSGIALICDGLHDMIKNLGESKNDINEDGGIGISGSAVLNFSAEAFNNQKERFYEAS